jgi:hypothetical protein
MPSVFIHMFVLLGPIGKSLVWVNTYTVGIFLPGQKTFGSLNLVLRQNAQMVTTTMIPPCPTVNRMREFAWGWIFRRTT